jgi:predicted transcriptional regulator
MGEVPLSLHVKAELKERLEEEARELSITPDALVGRAIESYLEIRGVERELLRQRIAEADKGVFISGEAMHRWIESWDTDDELPPPESDIFPTSRSR